MNKSEYNRALREMHTAVEALSGIVEGCLGKCWVANGKRLVDTPEWVRLQAVRTKANVAKKSTPKPPAKGPFKGFSFENGKIVDTAYLSGYHVGDRLLEGAYFKITVVNGNLEASPATKEDEGYLDDLNKKKWIKQAIKVASTYDIFSQNADGSGEELVLEKN